MRWTRILIRMDQRSKTTSHWNLYSDTVQCRELRSDRGSWFINEFFLKLAFFNIHDTFKAGNWSSYGFLNLVYFTNHDIFNCVKKGKNWETCWPSQPKNPKPNENEDLDLERRDLLNSDIPEFKENLVDDRVPERRDSHGSSSHVPSLEPTPARSADLGNQCLKLTHRKTEIARSVRGPKSQGPRAEDALSESYLVQKILVIWLQQITKFSVKDLNLETIIDMQSWCRTWPPNGSSRIRAKQKLLRKHKGACKSSWIQIGNRKSFTLTIPWNFRQSLWRSFLESLYVDTTQIGNKWCCWESSTESERRHLCSVVAIRSGWKLVGRFYGMLHLSAKPSRSLVWWEKTPYERRFGGPFKGPVIPFGLIVEYHPISAKDLSRLHQFVTRGRNLGRRHYGRRHWRIGGDGRIRAPRPKAQCKGSVHAYEWWKVYIRKRGWNGKTFCRRSGSENIHLNPGSSRPRRRTRKSSRRIRRIFFNPTSRLIAGCWYWRFHVPSSRGTPSQTERADGKIIPHSTEIYRTWPGLQVHPKM